jgi:hypothetical protein
MLTQRRLYWDTYQSWTEKIPEKYFRIELFAGHSRGATTSVCNLPGMGGRFMNCKANSVLAVGAQTRCSDRHIDEIIRANTVITAEVNLEKFTEFPLSLAAKNEILTEKQREESVSLLEKVPDGFLASLVDPVEVEPDGTIGAGISFDTPAKTLIRRLEQRVGPGGGWVEITVFFVCQVKKVE